MAQREGERQADPPGEAVVSLAPSTVRWLAETTLTERKSRGQYMTPQPVVEALIERISLEPGMSVLDPGVGTGELLAGVARHCPGARLAGWDIDPAVLAAARELIPGASLELRSALDPIVEKAGAGGRGAGFDLVIGNPPYLQVPLTPEIRARFGEVISGRANLFSLFFQAGLDLLAPGGTLAFVVPPSMNSGAYFEALREHITARASITDLTLLEGTGLFENANTAAQLLVLRKHEEPEAGRGPEPASDPSGAPFVFERSDEDAGFRRVIFSRNPAELKAGFEGRKTLWQLGYEAVTGTVVWNQSRAELSRKPGSGSVPLIWSGDLRGGTLSPGVRPCAGPDRELESDQPPGGGLSAERPGFVSGRPGLQGPALLVNRVVGAVGRGEIRTGLVPSRARFLAENHVNVIRRRSDCEPGCGWEELQARICQPGTADRLRLLTGNTQISATELTHLLPV